jgi:O-antigen ligase
MAESEPLRSPSGSRIARHWTRTLLLVLMATVPIVAVWPPDPFDPFFGIKATVILVLGSMLGCWWMFLWFSEWRPAVRLTPLLVLWLAFACWLTLSTVLSVDPPGAVWGSPGREDGLLVWLSGLVAFATSVTLPRPASWRIIWLSVSVCAIVVSAYAVAQHFGFDPLSSPVAIARGRSSGTLRNPLFLGGYLALVAPMAVAWCLLARKTWIRWGLAPVGLGVVFAALYFTHSRAAWLGAMGGVVLFVGWVVWRGRGETRVLAARLAVALIVALVLGLMPHSVRADTEQHSLQEEAATIVALTDPRNAGRLAIWEISLRMVGDRPWFGVGLDQMGTVFETYRTVRITQAEGAGTWDRAHSDPLQLAVVAGVPATLLFYALVVAAIARSRRKWTAFRPEAMMWAAATAGVIGYLAQSLVSITVPGVHTLFFVLLGGLAACADPLGRGGQIDE